MRVFLVCVLLLATVAAAPNGKNKNKNKNKNSNNDDEVADMRNEEERSDDRSDDRDMPELPNTRMLMEDNEVWHGPQYRMKSGDHDCMVQCKGSVSGRANMDSSYYRYISVNVTECLDRQTVFPADWMHEDWNKWNATVNKLMFRKPSGGSNTHRVPKRLSRPTELASHHYMCESTDKCFDQERSFGFAVYIPPMDMDVTWTVDWEVTARSPYGSMMSDSEVTGGVCEMHNNWMENPRSMRMEQGNWNLHRENREFSFWRQVGDNDSDQDRWDYMNRRDNRNGGDNRYQ